MLMAFERTKNYANIRWVLGELHWILQNPSEIGNFRLCTLCSANSCNCSFKGGHTWSTMKPQASGQWDGRKQKLSGTRYRITHSRVDPNADELVQIEWRWLVIICILRASTDNRGGKLPKYVPVGFPPEMGSSPNPSFHVLAYGQVFNSLAYIQLWFIYFSTNFLFH